MTLSMSVPSAVWNGDRMSEQTPAGSMGAAPALAPKLSSPATTSRTKALGPINKGRVLGVIALSQLMVVLDTTIVNIALPSAQRSLGFSSDSRQWVITAYALTFGSLLLVGGRLSDLVGRRRTLLIGLLGFALASAIGGAAPNFGLLVGARALQGAFAAVLAPAVLSTLNLTFQEGKERTRAFGVYAAVAGGGGTIGLVLGGVLTQTLSWRWCLYVNVLLVIPALYGVIRFVPAHIDLHVSDRSYRGIDVPGALTGPGGVFALVFGFSNAETHGWSAPSTIIMLAASVVLLSAFIAVETRVAHPLLPLQVVADRHRAGSYLSIAIIFSGIFSAFLFLSFLLQQNLHYSSLRTGLAFLPMSAGLVVAVGAVTTRLLPRFGPRPLVPTGMLLAGASMLWLSQLTPSSGYGRDVLGPLILLGVGGGLGFAPLISTATARIELAVAGVGSAMISTSQQVGGSVGLSILSIVYASAVGRSAAANHNLAIASVHGATVAFATAAGVFAAGAVIAALMLQRRSSGSFVNDST
jgi:EmrB/QacA subfamily drug resistance transporter